MKFKSVVFSALVVTALIGAPKSIRAQQASGPSVGGGGDVAIFPDGRVVIADPFLNFSGPQPNGLPPIRTLHPRLHYTIGLATKILATLDDGDSCPKKEDKKCELFDTLKTLAEKPESIRIYVVQSADEMGLFCASGGAKSYVLPSGVRIERAACTSGQDTFLVEPLFKQLSLGDQALLMLHERLTTLRDRYGGRNYNAVASVIAGLRLAIEIQKQQLKGDRNVLSEDQTHRIQEMYVGLAELQDMDSAYAGNNPNAFAVQVTPQGGAKLKTNVELEKGAFADLFTKIDGEACAQNGCRIASGTQIMNSRITFYPSGGTYIAPGQAISNVVIGPKSADYYFAFETTEKNPVVKWTWDYRKGSKIYFDYSSEWGRLDSTETDGNLKFDCLIGKTTILSRFSDKYYRISCNVTFTGEMAPHGFAKIDAEGLVKKVGLTKFVSPRAEMRYLPMPNSISKEGERYVIHYENK